MQVNRFNVYGVLPGLSLSLSVLSVYGANLWMKFDSLSQNYHVSLGLMLTLIGLSLSLAIGIAFVLKQGQYKESFALLGKTFGMASLGALLVAYLSDLLWITLEMLYQEKGGEALSAVLGHYCAHSFGIYVLLLICMIFSYWITSQETPGALEKPQKPVGVLVICLISALSLSVLPIVAHLYLDAVCDIGFSPLTPQAKVIFNLLSGIVTLLTSAHVFYRFKQRRIIAQDFVQFVQMVTRFFAFILCFQVLSDIYPYIFISWLKFNDKVGAITQQLISDKLSLMLIGLYVLSGVMAIGLMKKKAFDDHAKTSGKFGTAAWLLQKDYDGLYDPQNGVAMGTDSHDRLLYLPLANTLILAPPGGGKSLQLIQTLLTENRPIFALDVKGELAAVTARYRAEKMGRKVVILDCYQVLDAMGCHRILGYVEKFNPFEYLPEDEQSRSRVIDSFVDAFILTERDTRHKHFEEFAHTLIEE